MLPLLLTALAAGPTLDPIAGETLTAQDRDLLPSGRSLGAVVGHQFVHLIDMQNGGGGIGMFDRLYLSSHGQSWTQQHFMLNGIEITDPARPGSPLIELPHEAWDALTYRSLWTERPGFSWRLSTAPLARRGSVRVDGGGAVGGGTWLPSGLFDREPADQHGAPPDRRELSRAVTAAGALEVGPGPLAGRVYAEHVEQRLRYPLTLQGADGKPWQDRARRTTALAAGAWQIGPLPVSLVAGWQRRERDYEGAQYRWPQSLTGEERGNAGVVQLRASGRPWSKGTVEAGIGAGYRQETFSRHGRGPIVTDIEGEWLWLARPRLSEQSRRTRLDASLQIENEIETGTLRFVVRGDWAWLGTDPKELGTVAGRSYIGGAPEEQAVSITRYEDRARLEEWLGHGVARLDWELEVLGASLELTSGIDLGAVGTPGTSRLANVAPALGGALRMPLGDGELSLLLRREPDVLTAQVARFLNRDRGNGSVYAWLDDGDGVPQASERGQLLRRTGGRFHRADGSLTRPSSNQLAIAYVTPELFGFRARLTGTARWHLDRMTVRYDEQTSAGFERVSAEGRISGLTEGDGGAGSYPEVVYDRDLSTAGNEAYVLTNDPRPDFWIGSEIQFVSTADSWWFVNLGATGYWNIGRAPFGTFPDRNDPGVIDEVTADRNARINAYGRYDQDRSFAINLLAGLRPIERLLFATALRYRDGQPFTRYGVIHGLSQGPVPVMLYWRGQVRHTFHMSWDGRAQLALPFSPGLDLVLAVDVLNILGSGTELLEDPRGAAEFRRSLEMVPGRTVFATMTATWL